MFLILFFVLSVVSSWVVWNVLHHLYNPQTKLRFSSFTFTVSYLSLATAIFLQQNLGMQGLLGVVILVAIFPIQMALIIYDLKFKKTPTSLTKLANHPASAFRRICAFIVDAYILYSAHVTTMSLFFLVARKDPSEFFVKANLIASIFSAVFYFFIFYQFNTSIGKHCTSIKALGLMVVP